MFDIASAPTTKETGVLIHCSDANLTKNGDRKYIDNTRGKGDAITLPNPPSGVVATNNAFGGFMQGFDYMGGVVLCNDGPISAFRECRGDATFGSWRTNGNLKTNNVLVQTYGINEMAHYLSQEPQGFARDDACCQSSNLWNSKSLALFQTKLMELQSVIWKLGSFHFAGRGAG